MTRVLIILCVLAAPQLCAAQSVEDPMSYQVLLRMSGGLLLVVALVFAGAWFVRRFARLPTAGNARLQLLGGIAVGQRERVVLIRAGREHLLLGVAPGRVQMLHALQAELQPADAPVPGVGDAEAEVPIEDVRESFQFKLRGLLKRGGIG